jgi:CHAT domain-containing protein
MFVSQPTYVEKPKYMSAGRLFHSERKYQSDKTHVASTQVGHALVVGNPLPTREALLCGAEEEAEFVAELLSAEGFEVHALMRQAATKADVQSKIEGAKWAHLACHGNFDHHSKGPHILLADLSLLPGTFFILYSRFPR